jgi:DNA primase
MTYHQVPVVLMFDSDEAGQRATLRGFDELVLAPLVRKWYADHGKKKVFGEGGHG